MADSNLSTVGGYTPTPPNKWAIFKGWWLTAALLMGMFLIAFVLTGVDNKYTVTKTDAYQATPNQAPSPALAYIQWSPHRAKQTVPMLPQVLGIIFWVLIGVACWYVGTDQHVGNKATVGDPKNGRALLIIVVPVVLTAVMYFGWYSGRFANNEIQMPRSQFEALERSGDVKVHGCNGPTCKYTDASDKKVLSHLFDNKPIIK